MRTYADDGVENGPGLGRGQYREYEEDAPAEAPHDLVLGMPALTGIFLAVVLVCAVFFGFGYSTGRTLHIASPAPAAVAAPDTSTQPSPVTTTPPLAVAEPAAKPSAGEPIAAAGTADAPDETPVASPGEEAGFPPDSQPAPAPHHPALAAAQPVARTTSSPDEAPAAAVAPAAETPSAGIMVQIAAVMRQADAEMLATALRSNGYAAVVRTEPQDKFLHVQIGPFATRDQAKAMRARLQADGYNAFIKP
jgi:cell division septation protein DedD